MAEPTTNGLDALDQRMARARRNVPPPRRTAAAIAQAAGESSVAPSGDTAEQATPAITETAAPARPPATPPTLEPPPAPERAPVTTEVAGGPDGVRADEAQANLMVRVRRSLDRRLDHVIHELRYRTDIRTSKTELVEMLLWELPEQPGPELTERLRRYRQASPRR